MAPVGSCVLTLFLCVFVVIPCVVGETFDNVALRKNYSVISSYSSLYPPSYAADYSRPRTCFWSGSEAYQYMWWEVNLGRTYPVSVISIVTTSSSVLYPFRITVDSTKACVYVRNESQLSIRVACSSVQYGQVVRITRTDYGQFRLCDFQIYVPRYFSQCEAGRWGDQCHRFCSDDCGGPHTNFCHQETGNCFEENVATGKTYRQSSVFSSAYPASFAANGNTGDYFTSATGNSSEWWEVDLGRTYPVRNIILSRYYGYYLYPFTITVDGQLCVNESETSVQYGSLRTLTCSSVLYGRAVRITRTAANTELRLYEVEIKVPSGVSGCRPGQYGPQCYLSCSSYCNDGTGNTFCYQSTGHCYDDCQAGRYGPYCNQSCRSPRCVDNKCHRDTGLCIDYELKCATVNCSECVAGRWGNQCQYRCDKNCATGTCDHKAGNCSACLPGWYGDKCDQECRSKNCLLRMCYQETGRCEACNGNYAGDSCSECRDGFFRKTPDAAHCTECPWRCDNNTHCNKTSGTCDMCPVGWEGSRCLQRVDQQVKDQEGDNDGETEKLVAPVVGAIVGIGLLLTVSVVAAICLRNRSQKTDTNADTLNASSSGADSVAAVTNVYTISPTTASSSATEPMEDPPRENRDQRNPYESLGGYRNMTFQTEALFPIEMATASHHSDVSEEQTYVNSQGLNTKNA